MDAASVLDETFPRTPLLDLIRVTGIVLTALTMILAWRLTIKKERPYDVPMLWALTVYWLFAIIQEAQQIGRPFVWWRLPMLMIAAVLALISVRRRL